MQNIRDPKCENGVAEISGFICEVGGVTWVGWGCNHLIPSKGVEIFGGAGRAYKMSRPFNTILS